MGMPVVTNSVGAENIPAVVGSDWLVGNDENKFDEAMISALNDEKLRNNPSRNGQQHVSDNFSWKIAESRFREVFM